MQTLSVYFPFRCDVLYVKLRARVQEHTVDRPAVHPRTHTSFPHTQVSSRVTSRPHVYVLITVEANN